MIIVPAPVTPPEPLSQSVTVNLTPTQKVQVATSAAEQGVSMSAYVRQLLERRMANG